MPGRMAERICRSPGVTVDAAAQRRPPKWRLLAASAQLPTFGADSMRRNLLAAAAALPALLICSPTLAQAPAGGLLWSQLSPQQREALAPLAGQWGGMPAENKRKWLEIADRYPQLSPEGKARLQARMSEFSQLTPEQRRTARENFQRAYQLPRESRESAVEQYRALPEEKKKELNERSRRKEAAQPVPKM